jgi:general secretion pathway protein C
MHFVEGKWLGDDPEAAKPQRVKPKRPQVAKTAATKSGEALADRNMFCSSCAPPEPVVDDGGPIVDSDTPPATSLPLRLIATNVANSDAWSFATIHNSSSLRVGAYKVDDEIPEAGRVVRIRGRYVDFENKSSKRVERIAFNAKAEPKPRPTTPRTPRRTQPKDDLTSALDDGIKKVDDTHYEIDRALVEKIISNPTAIRGARIVPSIKNGKPNGFKLYAIRPSSAFAKIGLQNGDTIHNINGFDLTTPDKALEVYTKVREANSLSVSITRRGKSVNMEYNIQ